MEPQGVQRKLAVILSADVAAYSRLMGEDEEGTLRTLKSYREVIDGLIAEHGGRVFATAGDSVVAEFTSAVEAVRCAIKVQQELEKRNADLPEDRRMRLRIGVNLGDVMVEGDNLLGDGVNVAARLQGLAEPGGICISGTVFDQIESKLALEYESLGEQSVKNIAKPVPVYRVRMEPAAVPRVRRARRAGPGPWQTAALAAVVVLLVGGGAVAVWHLYLRPAPPPAEVAADEAPGPEIPAKPSIAVLPFTNMSGDPEQEYFSDGITEDIITDLSKVSGLSVTARHSTFSYKGKPVTVEQVGRELGVRYVLEGSVRKAGGRVRITAQLVDATTGNHLWAERYDRDLEDIFAVQDEVTRKVVSALAVTLRPEEQDLLRRRPAQSSEAYDLFLRAKRYSPPTTEYVLNTRKMFERAIDLDPEFAGGYAGSSWSHSLAVQHGFSESPHDDVEKAFELAQRAVAVDETFGWSHTALARAYLLKGEHDQAIVVAERAVQIQPSDADSYAFLGLYLMFAGRAEEAIEPIRKALRLNPEVLFSEGPYLNFSGFAYFTAGRYEEAVAAFEKNAARGGPVDVEVLAYATAAYSALGREEEARATAQKLLKEFPNFSLWSWPWLRLYKNPEDSKRLSVALRKAGLPE